MTQRSQGLTVTRWLARVLSVIFIGVILLFFFGEADFGQPIRLTAGEWIGVLFFPVGVAAGMILGWWREGAGAAVAVGSLSAFYVLDVITTGNPPSGPFFVLFTSPGILFGVSWLLRRTENQASADKEFGHFATHWFSGLMNGLESVDASARETILRECGKACAQSYTTGVFEKAWRQSADLEAFLAELATRFPEATYEQLTPHIIRVRYDTCECDLVKRGLVKSPLLCECSAHNLQENFCALGIPVTVTVEGSILRGQTHCTFQVALDESR
jgi:hypothetical protein